MKRKTITLKCGTIVNLTKYETETVGADVSLMDDRLHGYTAATEADALEGLAAHLKTIGANLEGIASALRREEHERVERYKAASPIVHHCDQCGARLDADGQCTQRRTLQRMVDSAREQAARDADPDPEKS